MRASRAVIWALTLCIALTGAVAVATAQTVVLPSPELPPPQPPPTPSPAPATPSAPAPATPSPAPAAPSGGTPAPAPTVAPQAVGPTAAQRAAVERARARRAERAAEARRRAAEARSRERAAGRARRAVISALRTPTGPLAGYVSQAAERAAATAPGEDGRRSDVPLAVGVALTAILGALVTFLAIRRRRVRRGRVRRRRESSPHGWAFTNRIMGRRGSRARNLIVTFGTTGLVLGMNIITGVIIARGLGPEGRGEVTAIASLPQTLAWLFAIGSIQAIAYHQSRHPSDARRLIGAWVGLLIPLGLIGVVVGELLIPVLLGAQTTDSVALAHTFVILTLFGVLTNISIGVLLGDSDFGYLNLMKVLQALGLAAGYVVLWLVGMLSVVSALAVTAVVPLAALVVMSWRVLRRHGIARADRTFTGATARYGLRAYGTDLGSLGNVRLDLTIIPAFLGAALVGYYAIAASIAGIFIALSGSVAGVLLAMASRDQQGGPRIILRATTALMVGCGSLAAIVWIFAPQAIELVYGPDFSASVTPLRILLPGAVLMGAASVVSQGLNALNRPFTAAIPQLAGLVITVVGLLVFLPIGGIEAAALTSLVAYSSVFGVCLLLYLREIRRQRVHSPGRGEVDDTAPAPHADDRDGVGTHDLSPRRSPVGRRASVPLLTRFTRHAHVRTASVVALITATALIVGWLFTQPGNTRLALLAALLAVVAGLGATSARLLVPALVVWLTALGFVRRVFTEIVEPTNFDLLLLIGPSVVIVLLVGTQPFRGAKVKESRLTRLVVALAVLVFAAGINPLNGSAVAGAGGLMFVLIPLLAYWIGMRIDSTTLMESLVIVGGLSLITSAYGLYQTFDGFPSWDQNWIDTSGYVALNVGGEIRSFSSFSSASEYTVYTAVGLVIMAAFLFNRARFVPVMLPLVALLGTALFLASARGIIFKLVAAIGLMIAARRGMRLSAAVAVALALVLLLPSAVSRIAPEDSDSQLIAHQVGGLSDPTNQETSTLGVHTSIIVRSLDASLHNPVGSGLSHVTIAGGRLGGGVTEEGGGVAAAETDIEAVSIAMGIPGILVFAAIFGLGFSRLYALAQREPGFLSLAGLGIITVTSLQWLNGGQYAVGILPWLMLGWAEARRLTMGAETSLDGEAITTLERPGGGAREPLPAR